MSSSSTLSTLCFSCSTRLCQSPFPSNPGHQGDPGVWGGGQEAWGAGGAGGGSHGSGEMMVGH